MSSFRRLRKVLIVSIGVPLSVGAWGCAAVDDLSSALSKEWTRLTAPQSTTAESTAPAATASKTEQLVPQKLIGLDQREVSELLGTATRAREVPPAVVWEYRMDACALDIFFYLDLASQRFRALAYDMKSADGKADDTLAICLRRFRDRDRGGKG